MRESAKPPIADFVVDQANSRAYAEMSDYALQHIFTHLIYRQYAIRRF